MSNENGSEVEIVDGDIQTDEVPGGRVIKPTGSIFTLARKVISKMTDIELKAHILEIKSKLQTKKQEVDSLTIMLSQATHEVSLREEKERIHLRSIKVPPRAAAKVTAANQADAFRMVVENLKARGLSPQQIAEFVIKYAGDKQ